MPVYEHDKDHPESIDARAAQLDPWVMYLVVRRERAASLDGLLVAAAQATYDAAARLADDPRYRDAFGEWASRSFRKVCLRANEKDWPRVAELDGGDGAIDGEPVVRALPPRRKSERERLLVALQAYTAEVAELPARAPPVTGEAPAMVFVLNEAVPMRAGKLVAQIGHAVLLCAHAFGAREADAFAAWAAAGRPCAVRRASGEAWAALQREEACAIVRDAGLTEVAHGSETFLALPPRPPGAWSTRVRALPAL
ncbi:MAG: peptidyl-tRNA hydrolase [Myxococcaceae bacterium]|nr:peptidyl-tRNA hydrolase [Myxococcaceae bacterium]